MWFLLTAIVPLKKKILVWNYHYYLDSLVLLKSHRAFQNMILLDNHANWKEVASSYPFIILQSSLHLFHEKEKKKPTHTTHAHKNI